MIVFEGDMGSLLATIADDYKTVIGFEMVSHQSQRTVKLSACFLTLDDIVTIIIGAAPEYEWRRQDSFIDVYPKQSALPLLDSVMSEFRLNNTDWSGAMQAVANLIESRSQLTNLHITLGSPITPSPYTRVPVTYFSVDLKNVTLRQTLHEVTKESGNSFWTFQISGNGQSFSIKNSMR